MPLVAPVLKRDCLATKELIPECDSRMFRLGCVGAMMHAPMTDEGLEGHRYRLGPMPIYLYVPLRHRAL